MAGRFFMLALGIPLACGCASGGDSNCDTPLSCPPTVSSTSPTIGSTGAETGTSDATGSTTGGSGDWWDCQFGLRIPLEVNASDLTTPLIDVPLLIVLDGARIDYAATKGDGTDVRFIDADGATSLAHEIEQWDVDGLSFFWVLLPRLDAAPAHLTLYAGNPDAVDAQAPPQVWAAGYAAVWHMADDLSDSTGNLADAIPGQSTTSSGFIGGARSMPGAGDATGIDVPIAPAIDGVFAGGGTISLWMRPLSFGGGGFGRIIDRATGNSGQNGWSMILWRDETPDTPGETLMFRRAFSDLNGNWLPPAMSVSTGIWQHLALVYDESSPASAPSIYLDGIAQQIVELQAPSGSPISEAPNAMSIAATPFMSSRAFDGSIDEVRIASVPRSAEWVSVQVRSTRDQLVTYGQSEPSSCP